MLPDKPQDAFLAQATGHTLAPAAALLGLQADVAHHPLRATFAAGSVMVPDAWRIIYRVHRSPSMIGGCTGASPSETWCMQIRELAPHRLAEVNQHGHEVPSGEGKVAHFAALVARLRYGLETKVHAAAPPSRCR